MCDGVSDQTGTNDGYFHALLLYRPEQALAPAPVLFCSLSPAWDVRGGEAPRFSG
jgi:hypothetical protein